ncbi:MAG: TIGR03545 family protein [Planctomycetales bacterium]|nr:TIGR03545 family protein [Planctomycetales bacterium]
MFRLVRWKYVGPRLFMVVAIVAALWWGLNPLLRLAFIQGGQAALGSRVEIGSLNASVLHGQLNMADLVVASPKSPLKNLFEAEHAEFDVDVGAALRRKLIIRDGVIDGLQFHTDRTSDGILPRAKQDSEESSGPDVSSIVKDAGKRGEAWFNDSLGKLELEAENDLESVRLSRDLKQRWPAEYKTLEERAKRIEVQSKQIRELAKAIADEPLKHLEEVPQGLATLEQLRRDVLELKNEIPRLQKQMKEDRVSIEKAKDHDIQYVRQRFKLDQLDGNALSEYLLGPVWSERIATAVSWIQWTRGVMPTKPQEREREANDPSINVLFPGYPARPDLLVQQLRLSGGGTIEGTPFRFSGKLRDLTHQPRRHPDPARLDINAEGSLQLTANVTFDRRQDDAVDEIVVNLPAVRQHAQHLGNSERLAVDVSPGLAHVQAHLFVRDEKIDGKIVLEQQQIALKPQLAPKYAKYVTPDSLEASLAGVKQLQAEVKLSGTLKRPRYELHSNLGPQLSRGINQALLQEVAEREKQLVARANREVGQELDKLQSDLMSKHGKILEQLELGDEQLNQIKKQLLSGAGSPADLIGRGKKLFQGKFR